MTPHANQRCGANRKQNLDRTSTAAGPHYSPAALIIARNTWYRVRVVAVLPLARGVKSVTGRKSHSRRNRLTSFVRFLLTRLRTSLTALLYPPRAGTFEPV